MQGSNVGLTVWVFGYAEATIVANDSRGALVRVHDTGDAPAWYPWNVLWKVQDESEVMREQDVPYYAHDGIAMIEYGDAWGDDL